MFGKAIATLIASVIEHTNMFCDTRLIRFHVKHAQGFQAKMCLHIFIWEPQGVGLWRSHSPNMYQHVGFTTRFIYI